MIITRLATGLALSALASTTLVSSANASGTSSAPESQIRNLKAQSQPASQVSGQPRSNLSASATTAACFTTPTGDTSPSDYPKADIKTICGVGNANTISVSLQVVQPTNPSTDPNWMGVTGIIFGLDTNRDGTEDFEAYFTYSGAEVRDTNSNSTQCDATKNYDGTTYSLSFPASCINSPTSFNINGFFAYDSDPADVNAPIYTDLTDMNGPVTVDSATPAPEPTQQPAPPSGENRSTGRLAGADRFSTAVAISKNVFPNGAPIAFLARADSYADALAGGTLSRGPILLVPQCGSVPEVVKAEVRRLGATEIVALGGPGAICDSVLTEVARS